MYNFCQKQALTGKGYIARAEEQESNRYDSAHSDISFYYVKITAAEDTVTYTNIRTYKNLSVPQGVILQAIPIS